MGWKPKSRSRRVRRILRVSGKFNPKDQFREVQMSQYRGRLLVHQKGRLNHIERLALELHLRSEIKKRGYGGQNIDVGALMDEADTTMGHNTRFGGKPTGSDFDEVKACLTKMLDERLPPKRGSPAHDDKVDREVATWNEKLATEVVTA
jgi:hypothetical protein